MKEGALDDLIEADGFGFSGTGRDLRERRQRLSCFLEEVKICVWLL